MSPTRPTLSQLSLVVNDVDASIGFYRRLGVDIPDEANWRSHHVGVKLPNGLQLDLDSVDLTKGYDPAWPTGPGATGVLVVFTVEAREEVDELYAELTGAGYEGHLAPSDAFWGARYAVVDDPDGNKVGLMSPTDSARGGPPPI